MKMRGSAVIIKGGLVPVLLVDEDGAAFAFDEVRDVTDAARFFAGLCAKVAKDLVNGVAIRVIEGHSYGETQHSHAFLQLSLRLQRFVERGKGYCLISIGAGRNHTNPGTRLFLDELEIILGQLR